MKYRAVYTKATVTSREQYGRMGEDERLLFGDSLTGAGAFVRLLTVLAVRELHRYR